ncbi:OST-HTH/LOTUS domain-containing protein [Chroococcidiopsis sp. CCNUC1]|jgi:hypothetical protein|nr:OST-HTH/LOTUS domain-containing protein [Chroococcidiopsis sp. CCNUC1]URD49719.1 OST-HTH/LOTUS domain-containing protein [Chroococcidiopsis sp. CCNUC1]
MVLAKKTPEAFVKACDRFIYTGSLDNSSTKEKQTSTVIVSKNEQASTEVLQKIFEQVHSKLKHDRELLELVKQVYDMTVGKDGWTSVGILGHQLHKMYPSFKSKDYGCTNLSKLIQSMKIFEIKQIPQTKNPNHKDIYIKFKNK